MSSSSSARSKLLPMQEDENITRLLEEGGNYPSSSSNSQADMFSDLDTVTTSTSRSDLQEEPTTPKNGPETDRSIPCVVNAVRPGSLEEIREKAVEEKKLYKVLNAQGKRKEALAAFKRGKELERKAESLENAMRKNRKLASIQKVSHDATAVNDKKKIPSRSRKSPDDDFTSELKELGWSEADSHNIDKKGEKLSVESELSSLLRENSQISSLGDRASSGIDRSQVIAYKRKALALKKEGKLTEAKEELKRAKNLERELEEQELLAEGNESDDELSILIRSINYDKPGTNVLELDSNLNDPMIKFDQINGLSADISFDQSFDVTDDDIDDPEMVSALKSFGWTDEDDTISQFVPVDLEKLKEAVLSLKREAVNQKKAGNRDEAMKLFKQAKLQEKELENLQIKGQDLASVSSQISEGKNIDATLNLDIKQPPKSKVVIQRELLNLKKKALTLRREGRIEEAEEELRKGTVLELQLEKMDKPNPIVTKFDKKNARQNPSFTLDFLDEDDGDELTDQDMKDPELLSVLGSMGWTEEASDHKNNFSLPISANKQVRSKAEIQKELLGIKRKALTLRRQGKVEEADEELRKTKDLENQLVKTEKETVNHVPVIKSNSSIPSKPYQDVLLSSDPFEDTDNSSNELEVSDKDMKDPLLLSVLENMGWKEDDETESTNIKKNSKPIHDPFVVSTKETRSKAEIQKELLGIKRKALALRRQGKFDEADKELKKTGDLEDLMAETDITQHQSKHTDLISTSVLDPAKISEKKLHAMEAVPSSKTAKKSDSLFSLYSEFEAAEVNTKPSQNIRDSIAGGVICKDEFDAAKEVVGEANSSVSSPDILVAVGEANSAQEYDSLKEKVLAQKRKAVSLKREGKLVEAREELRQIKQMEKNLQEADEVRKKATSDDRSMKKESIEETSPQTQKPLSGRDRFKIQQESLGHKRKAMKLRREGKMEESEVEYELAKKLEAQIEESSSKSTAKTEDTSLVEDFLDPQLMTALKSIGIDGITSSKSDAATLESNQAIVRRVPPTDDSISMKTSNLETKRNHIKEQIKAEKIRALNLKRAGNQADALEALRSAKLFEKKLASLAS